MYFHIHFILCLASLQPAISCKRKIFTPSQLNNITK
uniref:Homeobox domain-containing protein n=1 Tax=Anguilla anguilla TaxID=7936 RepID=A0A0E9SVH0_ANGAN